MNEELLIKLKVDTSAVSTSINKLKNEVSNVNKTISTMGSSSSATSKSTAEANKNTSKLSQAIGKLTAGMQKLKGVNFGNLVTTVGATTVATNKLEQAISKLKDTTKKTANPNAGSFSAAFQSLNPNSQLYEDVEWEGMDAAWNNFNANFAQGFGDALDQGKVKFKNFVNSIKNFKAPKSMAEFSKMLENLSNKTLAPLKSKINGLKEATAAAGGGFRGFSKAIAGSSAAIAAAGAALTAFIAVLAAFVAAGVAAAFSVSKLGDEVYHSASKFGFSTKAYQEWSYVMERSGSSIEDLKGFLETLGSEQAAVITGSEEAAQKFKNLGISAEEAAGMDSQELFETTIKKLQGISSATERSAYAYSLFGDEASRLMNVINMSNGEMQEAINQYNLLGGAMSGELVEKSNRLQNSIANMKQAWQGISNTLAEVFIPVVQKVVNWLTKAFVWVNLFLRTIFGLDLTSSAKSTDKAASSTNKYTGGIKAATKAAEELKRTTMGFDELNIVQDPNKGGSADTDTGAGAFDTSGMPSLDSSLLNMEDLNLDSMYAWFEKYKGLIAQITTWSLILIGAILAVIGVCAVNIPLALLGLGLFGAGIAIGISSGAFGEAWEAIKKAISSACSVIGDVVKAVAGAIGNFFSTVGEGAIWIGEKIGEFLIFLATLPVKLFKLGVEMGAKLGEAISTKLAELKDKISNWWSGVKSWFGSNIKPVFTKEYWANKFEQMKKGISEKLTQVGEKFTNTWNNLKTGAKGALEGVKNTFSNIPTWFKEKFTAAWTAVKNVFSKGGQIFDGIKEGISSTFKTIVNGLITGINKVISVPFNAINKMLNTIRNVNILGVEPFKGLWKQNPLSVPQIPKLAKGGLITGSVLANIGEAGNELVLPLEQNTGWMDTLADKIAARNGGPSKIVLQVGEKELGWATIDSINSITKQTGAIQLTL